ncbi:hypothetical protein [Rhizobium sp. RAF56]|uniref:hypothetical protein n=1 Tax=Rhizobium sp. RAF56 TaxID=3233062 RepID=UPI003F983CE1
MGFTKIAQVLALLAVVSGVIGIVVGFVIATGVTGWSYEQALTRYGGGATSSGQVIDRGLYLLLFGVALGTLAEISLALHNRESL